jgi:hypothetical protein
VVGQHSASPQVITHGVDVHSETYQTVGGAQRAQVMNVDLTDPNNAGGTTTISVLSGGVTGSITITVTR